MKYRRGQAALEFLSTYGFAFLIILVMVGALTYFGVLNPSGLVPNKCLAGNGIKCVEARFVRTAATTLTADIVLQNDRGTTTTLAFPLAGNNICNAPGYGALAGPGAIATNDFRTVGAGAAGAVTTTVPPGERTQMHCVVTTTTLPSVGEKLKLTGMLTYLDAGATFAQSQSIDITQVLS